MSRARIIWDFFGVSEYNFLMSELWWISPRNTFYGMSIKYVTLIYSLIRSPGERLAIVIMMEASSSYYISTWKVESHLAQWWLTIWLTLNDERYWWMLSMCRIRSNEEEFTGRSPQWTSNIHTYLLYFSL